MGPVEITAGAAAEGVSSPVGLLPPRDSNILPTTAEFEEWQLSPKLGVTATFKSNTTLRAAVFSRLASSIGRLQTLEPTQVSGFNQFYEDVGGTHSWNYGIGVDQQFAGIVFFGGRGCGATGASLKPPARRPTRSPDARASRVPSSSSEQATTISRRSTSTCSPESGSRSRLTGISTSAGSIRRRCRRSALFQDRFETQRIRPQVRVFLPIGFFASVTGSHYDQEVDQFDDLTSTVRTTQTAKFWTVDAAVGWRLPRRLGSISIEGSNLLDEQFNFYEQSLQENVIPTRRVGLRADFAF